MTALKNKPQPIRNLRTVFAKPLVRIAVPSMGTQASSLVPSETKIDTSERNIELYRADLARFIGKCTKDFDFSDDRAA